MSGPMQALVWAGGTDVAVEERPRPEAADGQVLVDVAWCGLCGTDLHIAHNQFPSWPPVTLGHEFCGRAADVGADVEGWSAEDRVVCEPHSLACGRCHLCRRGHAELCAHKRSPGWGIDGGMAAKVAAQVPGVLPVEPGSTVAVFGPGAVGLLAAMVAWACGVGRGGRGRHRRPPPAGAAVRARHGRPPRAGGPLGPGHAAGPGRQLPAVVVLSQLGPAPLTTVFPLDDWWAAFDAIADRSVVKTLLDPRPGHENGAAP